MTKKKFDTAKPRATPPEPAVDPLALVFAVHDLAGNLRALAQEYATLLLPMVLTGTPKLDRPSKRKALARLKAMMPEANYAAILARHRRP